MKLEIGISDYEVKGINSIAKAHLLGRRPGKNVPLIVIAPANMADMHKVLPHVRGCPRYVSFDPKTQRVWLHPIPDGEYLLEVIAPKPTHTLSLPKKAQA